MAVHELGHSLGLGHSDVQSAIMAPFYRGYKPNLRLHQDDIDKIRYLYGRRSGIDYYTLTLIYLLILTYLFTSRNLEFENHF